MNTTYPLVHGEGQSPHSIYEALATQHHRIGSRGTIGNRTYYYARSSGAAIGASTLCRHAAGVSNHTSVTTVTGTAGSRVVTATLGATSAAANLYQNGWFIVIDGTGSGQARMIEDHSSASSSGILTATLFDALETTLAGTEEITLLKGEFADVVVTPGNAIVQVAGVPNIAVPVGSTTQQFFWIQTWGWGLVQGDASAISAGRAVTLANADTADAGQVTLLTFVSSTASQQMDPTIGFGVDVGDSSDLDFKMIDLRIAK